MQILHQTQRTFYLRNVVIYNRDATLLKPQRNAPKTATRLFDNRDAARHVATRPLRQNRANSMPFSKVYVKNIPIVALTREWGGCSAGDGRSGNPAKVVDAGHLSRVLSPS